ncbi:MAG: hypothetical protein SGARI_007944 [Bacillariaceae sp.]
MVEVVDIPSDLERSTQRGSSFLQSARSSFLRRVSGLSNGDIESGAMKDDDTVESVDMEDEDELMGVSAPVAVIASGSEDEQDEEPTAVATPRTHSTRKLVGISLLLLVIGLALGLGLGLGLSGNNNSSNNNNNASLQSNASSTSTTSPQEDIYSEREHTVRPTEDDQDSEMISTLFPEFDDDDECFPDFDPEAFTTTFVEFPCLLGMTGEEAAAALEEAYPNMLDIQILTENSPITMDLRFNRVRIFVSHLSQLVVQVPHIG